MTRSEPPDRLFDGLFFTSDWWTHLYAAQAWEKAARLLEAVDPCAARQAWAYAARSYGIYREAFDAHRPASRWDHDYGPELSTAESKMRALPEGALSDALPSWAQLVLDRRFTDAMAALGARPQTSAERAMLPILALACRRADREDDADRLELWAKAD
jgi:hypothetical protein